MFGGNRGGGGAAVVKPSGGDLDEDEDLDEDLEDDDLKEELQATTKKSPIQKTIATKEDYIKEVEEYKRIGKKSGDKWINGYLESKKFP